MNRVLEIAQAKCFIDDLEFGLRSCVEQGGTNFSGGQRQRIKKMETVIQ